MKSMFKTFAIAGVILLFLVPALHAQQAVIREMAGTVEIKEAGSEIWTAARQGQTLAENAAISTGFRSSAIIALGDSLLTVRPLTRLSVGELSRTQAAEKVELSLQTGRVRAEVKSSGAARTDFTVRGPSATASVRGTDFEFDTVNLSVREGTVSFAGSSGIPVVIDAGRMSFTDESSGRAAPPEETAALELKPQAPVGADAAGLSGLPSGVTGATELSITVGF